MRLEIGKGDKMKKFSFISLLLVFLLIGLTGCGFPTTNNPPQANNKLQVMASFNAMQEITEAIGKDKIQVTSIIPNGTEPHGFQPSAKNLTGLHTAKVFIYNGLDMEKGWLDKTITAADNKNLLLVNASKGAVAIPASADTEDSDANIQNDPHLWLSVKGAQLEAKNIKEALVTADPKNSDFYEKNYKTFYDQLEQLYINYTEKFNNVKSREFVAGHAAFAYLARDFGLKQNSVQDVFAEGEPSAKKLKDLTDYCKKQKINTIFVEDMVSPKVSETLANEVGAKAVKIYTLASKEDGKTYIESIEANLDRIYTSLK